MKTWKGLAIVGALALGAVLSSLPVTGQGRIPLPSLGQWKQFCKTQAETPELCLVVASALDAAVKDELDNSTTTFIRNVLAEIKKALHLTGNASCTECLNSASQFLDLLAQNSTEQEIVAMGVLSCEQKFDDPVLAEQCEEFINANLPQVIQHIENDLTPGAICVALKHCPAP